MRAAAVLGELVRGGELAAQVAVPAPARAAVALHVLGQSLLIRHDCDSISRPHWFDASAPSAAPTRPTGVRPARESARWRARAAPPGARGRTRSGPPAGRAEGRRRRAWRARPGPGRRDRPR